MLKRPSLKEHLLEIVKKKRRNTNTKAFRTTATDTITQGDPASIICGGTVENVRRVEHAGQTSPSDKSTTVNTTSQAASSFLTDSNPKNSRKNHTQSEKINISSESKGSSGNASSRPAMYLGPAEGHDAATPQETM